MSRQLLDKLGEAGIQRSVMILNGLGGAAFSAPHAENSARLANATQPEFLSSLVVSFPQGEARFREHFPDYQPLDQGGLFRELRRFIEHLALDRTVFRSDHASNWLALRGTLGADRERLLAQLDQAIHDPDRAPLRPEWSVLPKTSWQAFSPLNHLRASRPATSLIAAAGPRKRSSARRNSFIDSDQLAASIARRSRMGGRLVGIDPVCRERPRVQSSRPDRGRILGQSGAVHARDSRHRLLARHWRKAPRESGTCAAS